MMDDFTLKRIEQLMNGMKSGRMDPRDCRDELRELTAGTPYASLASLLEADEVISRLADGSVTEEEGLESFRSYADLHPSIAIFFLDCSLVCLKIRHRDEALGYAALYLKKKELLAEVDYGWDEDMEEMLGGLFEELEECEEPREIWDYLETGGDHLVNHFLLQHILDGGFDPYDDEVFDALMERRAGLVPLLAATLEDQMDLAEMGMGDAPPGLEALIALAGMSASLDVLPALMHVLAVTRLEPLNEAMLALAKLGHHHPGEVTAELRRVAMDPEAGEPRLAAVDALGILGEAPGNLGFLLEMLEGLEPAGELSGDLFKFLAHALLSSRKEAAAAAVSASLEEMRVSLDDETFLFAKDYLDNYRNIVLGPRLADILAEEPDEVLAVPLADLDIERRSTLTMTREWEFKREEIARLRSEWVEECLKFPKNLPCRCGSGLRFKKCCLPRFYEMRDALAEEEDLYGSDFSRLTAQLGDFAHIPSIWSERAEALEEFLEVTEGDDFRNDPSEEAGTLERSIFEEWFLFDRPLAGGGRTPAEKMLERLGDGLPPETAGLLRDAALWRFSVYEVQEVVPGKRLVLRDIFRGGDVTVEEEKGSLSLARWDLLACHVMKCGEGYVVAGATYRIMREFLDPVDRFVRRTAEDFTAAGDADGLDGFLRRYGYLVFHQTMELVEKRPKPTMTTAEGDLLTYCEALYDISDPAEVRRRLADHPWIEDEGGGEAAAESGGPVFFSWHMSRESEDELRRGEHLGAPVPSRTYVSSPKTMSDDETRAADAEGLTLRTFGRLSLEGSRLVFETHSRERLERGKRELGEILDGLATHRVDTIRDQESLLSDATAKRSGEAQPFTMKDMSPEERQDLMKMVTEKIYANWLDTPIPYLGGKTPREAAATPEGRGRVNQLLKDYENSGSSMGDSAPRFDFNRFRIELGISLED